MSDTDGGNHSCSSGPKKKIVGVGPMKANRSIRDQELSVLRGANVDIVPAPARKNNNPCVSAKRGEHGPPRPRELPYSVSATPDHQL